MKSEPYQTLIQVTPEEIEIVQKRYNLDKTRIRENIDQIEEWCKKQEHLQEAFSYLSRDNIERIHILARGSVEATKLKIDKILTIRAMIPEIISNKSTDEFRNFTNDVVFVMMPKLTPTCQSRVFVTQFKNNKFQDNVFLSYVRYCSLINEFRLYYDYSMSERHIIDLKNTNISILAEMHPMIVKKAQTLCMDGYGAKINGIHFLNAPFFIDKIVYLFKQYLKDKIANRIYVHDSYDELHEVICKEILPKEYGGDEMCCTTIREQWNKYIGTENAQNIIDISNKLHSDESKRTHTKFNEEYLGMPGTFRRLNVD